MGSLLSVAGRSYVWDLSVVVALDIITFGVLLLSRFYCVVNGSLDLFGV